MGGVDPPERTWTDDAAWFGRINQGYARALLDEMEGYCRADDAAADNNDMFLCHVLHPEGWKRSVRLIQQFAIFVGK